ncbi:MAG: regulatory signaling modulator protein AmpE [Hahellaceae bacterium]|nr:regulatory signaling modulator protein AmpE [Hahellaceae bacterium]
MHFFSLLVAYLLQQKFDLSLSLRFDAFLGGVFGPLCGRASRSSDLIYALLLLNAVVFGLILLFVYLLNQFLWGVGAVLFDTATLLLLLGGQGYRSLLDDYHQSWGRGDIQSACYKSRMLGAFYPPQKEVTPEVVHLALVSAYLNHHFTRFFTVLFWFFIAGPAGGVMVRLNQHLASKSYGTIAESASAINHMLDWLPARFLVFTFAIAGDFVGCLKHVRGLTSDYSVDASKLIMLAASGALDQHAPDKLNGKGTTAVITAGESSLRALRSLTSRSLAVWLCAFALISILLA